MSCEYSTGNDSPPIEPKCSCTDASPSLCAILEHRMHSRSEPKPAVALPELGEREVGETASTNLWNETCMFVIDEAESAGCNIAGSSEALAGMRLAWKVLHREEHLLQSQTELADERKGGFEMSANLSWFREYEVPRLESELAELRAAVVELVKMLEKCRTAKGSGDATTAFLRLPDISVMTLLLINPIVQRTLAAAEGKEK